MVAEQVEKVSPNLVARDADGKVNTVRYEAVNAMLLNEFLKEHRKVQQLESKAQEQERYARNQEAMIAQQQNEIKALSASMKEQASQIQKVSAQVELNNLHHKWSSTISRSWHVTIPDFRPSVHSPRVTSGRTRPRTPAHK